jgi:hypothetical protein
MGALSRIHPRGAPWVGKIEPVKGGTEALSAASQKISGWGGKQVVCGI